MTAATLDIVIEQGTTFTKNITWTDDTGPPPLPGAPIDITGYTARMQLRTAVDAPDPPIIELTDSNGRITLGGAAGTIDLLISDVDTAALTDEFGVYDLELESPGGVVTRLLEGNFELSLEVTR